MRRLSLGSLIRMKAFSQQEPFGGGKEIRHVGRRGCFLHCVSRTVHVGRALEEERYWSLQNVGDLLQRLAPMRLVPFSYFCTCWNVRPSASPSFPWFIASIMRRMRTRRPTCLSTGLGDFSSTLANIKRRHFYRWPRVGPKNIFSKSPSRNRARPPGLGPAPKPVVGGSHRSQRPTGSRAECSSTPLII